MKQNAVVTLYGSMCVNMPISMATYNTASTKEIVHGS